MLSIRSTKIGLEEVEAELLERGLDREAIDVIKPVLLLEGSNSEKIESIAQILASSHIGMQGVEEIRTLFGLIEGAGVTTGVELDLSLARGLNYYTGAIFEVKALDFAIGSVCGGGRYDDLTGIFGLPNMSGVGISFGADRIYDVLKGLDLFPQEMASASTVLFSNMGEDEVAFSVPVAALLRRAGIACEIYPDNTKLRKQFEYADKKGIPYLAIVGANEIAEHSVTLKNLTTGEQQLVKIPEIIDKLNQVLNV